MPRYIKTICFVALFIFGALVCQANIASARQIIDAPTVMQTSQYELGKPFITGLTPAGTEVLVYIDGIFAGLAEINEEGTEADNFYYEHDSVLSEGIHEIMLASRDRTSLVLSAPGQEIKFVVPALSAPTLIEPSINTATGKVKPFIKGLTLSGTFIRLYIDGIYNGKTDVVVHDSGTANFAYKPFLNLTAGHHFVQAVSEDSLGNKSKKSDTLNFNIEQPMPAPTLFAPEFNNKTEHDSPFIVGVTKNNSLIKVFIDHKLDGQFKAENSESGAADFAYRPFRPLTSGNHFMYATATDSRGKESSWSNIVYFNIAAKLEQPALAQIITEQAEELKQEEEQAEEAKIEVKGLDSLEDKNVVIEGYEEELGDSKEKTTDDDIKKIIGEEITVEEADQGLINENKNKQGGLNLNLVIFITFLFGIIIWIFWVNKELIKERRAQEEKQEIPESNLPAGKDPEKDISKDKTLFSGRDRRH